MIDTKLFFKTGIFTFLIIGLCDFANFFIFFETNNIYSKVGTLARVFFDFITSGFFYYLLKTQTSSLQADTSEELKEALGEFNK